MASEALRSRITFVSLWAFILLAFSLTHILQGMAQTGRAHPNKCPHKALKLVSNVCKSANSPPSIKKLFVFFIIFFFFFPFFSTLPLNSLVFSFPFSFAFAFFHSSFLPSALRDNHCAITTALRWCCHSQRQQKKEISTFGSELPIKPVLPEEAMLLFLCHIPWSRAPHQSPRVTLFVCFVVGFSILSGTWSLTVSSNCCFIIFFFFFFFCLRLIVPILFGSVYGHNSVTGLARFTSKAVHWGDDRLHTRPFTGACADSIWFAEREVNHYNSTFYR